MPDTKVAQMGPMEAWVIGNREAVQAANRPGLYGDLLAFARQQDALQAELIAALEAAHPLLFLAYAKQPSNDAEAIRRYRETTDLVGNVLAKAKGGAVCQRCKGHYGDPNVLGGICGTCADDLRGEQGAE